VRPVVITACTNRKRETPSDDLMARALRPGSVDAVCAAWTGRLRECAGRQRPLADLYCGRAFREAEAANRAVQGALLVASAGLGLVSVERAAPSYSLTLARESADCILGQIHPGSPADWWRALEQASPIVQGDPDQGGLILAALSRPYLDMVAEAWAEWPAERRARLRLFCKDPPNLPPALAEQWMPYDDRLDRLPGWAGTQGDFAQRALHHFAKSFFAEAVDAGTHAAAVRAALAPYQSAAKPNRDRHDDEALVAIIVAQWDTVGGRSGAMLRRLRRELDIACEQGRFRTLFQRAAAQRQGALR
jgi:hypothetical protein